MDRQGTGVAIAKRRTIPVERHTEFLREARGDDVPVAGRAADPTAQMFGIERRLLSHIQRVRMLATIAGFRMSRPVSPHPRHGLSVII
jgi:hypothetical protein